MRRLALLLSLAACSGNAPPTWTSAPTTLHLVQGETQSVTMTLTDADGDPVVAKVVERGGRDGARLGRVRRARRVRCAGRRTRSPSRSTTGAAASRRIRSRSRSIRSGGRATCSGRRSGPIAREHGTFLIDETTRTAFLLGGSGYQPQGMALADFWKLDVDAGHVDAVTPTGDVPPPLASARAVRMPGTTTAYMFGGYTGDGTTDTGELYRVEYGGGALAFTKLTQVSQPLPRELHGFGYDPQTQTLRRLRRLQLRASARRWPIRGSCNYRATPRRGRSSRARRRARGMASSTAPTNPTGRFFVYSGAQNPKGADTINAAQDTWALDLRSDAPTWTQVLDGTEANHAPGRRNGCFVVDPRGPSLYVFGGTSDGMTTQPGLVGARHARRARGLHGDRAAERARPSLERLRVLRREGGHGELRLRQLDARRLHGSREHRTLVSSACEKSSARTRAARALAARARRAVRGRRHPHEPQRDADRVRRREAHGRRERRDPARQDDRGAPALARSDAGVSLEAGHARRRRISPALSFPAARLGAAELSRSGRVVSRRVQRRGPRRDSDVDRSPRVLRGSRRRAADDAAAGRRRRSSRRTCTGRPRARCTSSARSTRRRSRPAKSFAATCRSRTSRRSGFVA